MLSDLTSVSVFGKTYNGEITSGGCTIQSEDGLTYYISGVYTKKEEIRIQRSYSSDVETATLYYVPKGTEVYFPAGYDSYDDIWYEIKEDGVVRLAPVGSTGISNSTWRSFILQSTKYICSLCVYNYEDGVRGGYILFQAEEPQIGLGDPLAPVQGGDEPSNPSNPSNPADPSGPDEPAEPVSPNPPPANPFVDVTKSAYYYEPVLWAIDNGVTTGVSDTSFAPDAICTRGQIVTFLYRSQL